MPVFDVAFTVKTFRRLSDDSQVSVEKLLGRKEGIVAATANAAIATAAAEIVEEQSGDEIVKEFLDLLPMATVSVRAMP